MMKKVLFLSALCLTGCSTMATYSNVHSVPVAVNPTVAVIQNYRSSPTGMGNSAVVQQIDGKGVSYATWGGSQARQSVTVAPGHHTLLVMNEVNHGAFSIPRRNLIEMDVTVKAGEQYQLQQSVDGNFTSNWLTNSKGDKASTVVTAMYKKTV